MAKQNGFIPLGKMVFFGDCIGKMRDMQNRAYATGVWHWAADEQPDTPVFKFGRRHTIVCKVKDLRVITEAPEVIATATRATSGMDKVWIFKITCPFCGLSHTHGGGTGDAPALYGHRTAHCSEARPFGYILVPEASAVEH
jgi:hypothetical protein